MGGRIHIHVSYPTHRYAIEELWKEGTLINYHGLRSKLIGFSNSDIWKENEKLHVIDRSFTWQFVV